MKKITALFILILSLIVVMLPVQAAELDLVTDEVGLLTDDERVQLNQIAEDITEQYQCEVSIMVIDDKGDDEITSYAKSIYDQYDYGYGDDKSGMMLLISMKDRDYTLLAYGYGNTAFTDHGKDVLADDYLLPLLGEDQYYDGLSTYLNQTAEFLNMAKSGTPFDVDTDENAEGSLWINLAIVIIVPLIIAGIVCFIFFNQMKTAVSQSAADNYMLGGGVNLTMKDDRFLFETETRTEIEDESSSGGTSTDSDDSSSTSGNF